ncbi:MAG: copper chaperone PCu(A)C [Chloroflexi bacterium]|nr:copper chaperone PCu(A)C [Chloroflexota bacterium]
MKKIIPFILIVIFLLSACGPKGTDIQAGDYWARAALKDGNSAAYMTLANYTDTDDELIGVSCDIATAAEIHLSQMSADGVMQMLPQESVSLPSGGELELKPGSYHIMLIGLKQDLKVGEKITLTLHFKNHADIVLTVPVQEAEDMGGSGMDGHMP